MIAESVRLAAQDLRFARPSASDFSEASDVRFPWGLPGFPHLRRFALVETPAMEPSMWLRSATAARVALPLVDPWAWFRDYEPLLPAYAYVTLELSGDEDAIVANVVLPAEAGRPPTVNLFAPIIINRRTRIGRQIVLENSAYEIRTPFPETAPAA